MKGGNGRECWSIGVVQKMECGSIGVVGLGGKPEMGPKFGIGVVLNYTYLHAITRIYTRFVGGNVTGVWPRMKHGQNTDSKGTLNTREPRFAAKERREREKGWEMEYGSRGVVGCRPVWVEAGRKVGRKWEKAVRVWV